MKTLDNEYFTIREVKTLVGCACKRVNYKTLTMVHMRITRNETLDDYEGAWQGNPSLGNCARIKSQTLASH